MSKECKEAGSPFTMLKDESARQRWELFHRAIAHAKRTNDAALDDGDAASSDHGKSAPLLSIVR